MSIIHLMRTPRTLLGAPDHINKIHNNRAAESRCGKIGVGLTKSTKEVTCDRCHAYSKKSHDD